MLLLGKVAKFCYLSDTLDADGGHNSAVMAELDAELLGKVL